MISTKAFNFPRKTNSPILPSYYTPFLPQAINMKLHFILNLHSYSYLTHFHMAFYHHNLQLAIFCNLEIAHCIGRLTRTTLDNASNKKNLIIRSCLFFAASFSQTDFCLECGTTHQLFSKTCQKLKSDHNLEDQCERLQFSYFCLSPII